MKKFIIPVILVLLCSRALAQEIVIVSEVKCLDQNCTVSSSCTTDFVTAITGFSSGNPFGCTVNSTTSCHTDCNAIPPFPSCFAKAYLNNLTSDGWLNFINTPVGLTSFKKIKIFDYAKNALNPDNPPTFNGGTISFNSGGVGAGDFTIIDAVTPTNILTGGGSGTLEYSATNNEFWVKFTPSAAGNRNVTITVGSVCPVSNIKFNGEGIARPAKQIVLAMDCSGSMAEPYNGVTGSPSKLQQLNIAAGLFLDLGDASDQFGGVGYDDAVYPKPLGTSVPNLKAWIGEFVPGGSTGIGKAVDESFKILNGGSVTVCDNSSLTPMTSANKVVVLLTDGIENVAPYVDQARSPRVGGTAYGACLKQASIYTIGFGQGNQLNEAMLSYLPQLSAFSEPAISGDRGYYHVDSDITSPGAGQFNLSAAYYKIYASANDIQNVVDPTVEVSLYDNLPKIIHNAAITTSDLKATFAVFEQENAKQYYELELLSPDGQKVTNGAMSNGLAATLIEAPGYRVYKVDFSGAGTPAAYSGTWKLQFTAKVNVAARKEIKGMVPIGFAASAFSNLRMKAQAEATIATPGNEIRYVLALNESGIPLSRTFVNAQVKTPSGNIFSLSPVRDNDGNWVASFSNTFEPGTYELHTRAVVYNRKGEVATREGTQYIAMAPQAMPEAAQPCFSCMFWWIVFGIVALFILILVIRAIRKA